jgi:uncharacterized protein YbgA (DUF1722 family)
MDPRTAKRPPRQGTWPQPRVGSLRVGISSCLLGNGVRYDGGHKRDRYFVERVFCYRRWRDLVAGGLTRGTAVAFHAAHKLLLLAHSPKHYAELGRLVAEVKQHAPRALASRYGLLFMAAPRLQATPKKHANVLHHILGYLKRDLDGPDKAELVALIEEYRLGLIPLVVPPTLFRHHLARIRVPYLERQVYFNPHPKELMLRNHA